MPDRSARDTTDDNFLAILRTPLVVYRDRVCAAVPLGGGTHRHRIASRRRIAAPALFPLLRRLAGGSSFFARSTRLLAREIARIASRQYLDSRRVAKRNGRRVASFLLVLHHLLLLLHLFCSSTSSAFSVSQTLFLPLCLLTLYFSSHLVAQRRPPPASRGYAAKEALRAIPFSRIHARPGNSSSISRRTRTGSRFSAVREGPLLLYGVRLKTRRPSISQGPATLASGFG